MNSPRNSTMNGSVKRKPATPCRLPAFFLRRPGARVVVGAGAVAVAMSVRGGVGEGGARRRRAPSDDLLPCDRHALLLGVVDDGGLPRLECRGGTVALGDARALDGVALRVHELVDRIPLPGRVHGVRGRLVDLVHLLAAVERIRLVLPLQI